jgi:hypothetical protein
MSRGIALPLPVVDGLTLPAELRAALRPGAVVSGVGDGDAVLPRYFFRIDEWEQACAIRVAPDFLLREFISVDVRETPAQLRFPRYVPCAITLLAAHLQVVRDVVGTYVHIAANGGYRTPSHRLSGSGSLHCWGTAANLHRIGDDDLDTRERIERYTAVVRRALPGVRIKPYGLEPGCADDHLHLDLGYVVMTPRHAFQQS